MKCLAILFSSMLLLSSFAFADDLKLIGKREQSIPLTHPEAGNPAATKDITVLEYELPAQWQTDVSSQSQRRLEQQIETEHLPQQVQLGMNRVPVLDQGHHGTCATFASTAAVDAALHKGNYISQLCLLQLGNYLQSTNQGSSGWDGANTNTLLSRMASYGIVNIENQGKYGCGGITTYPHRSTPSLGMTVEEYEAHQEPLLSQLKWKRIFWKSSRNNDVSNLNQVKSALHEGSRVVVQVLLPRTDLGEMGAVGWHYFWDDTWVFTPEMKHELETAKTISGHAMIITGYDDNASARDHAGHLHHGLLTLRNSWGRFVGDWGDFYMSYDYFKALARDGVAVTRVR
ncbi:MAG: C1 family peptidase [Gammaproteobacteria bacterium]|nr:C1 family peptidase [Gammaproteobacteria bacterium]